MVPIVHQGLEPRLIVPVDPEQVNVQQRVKLDISALTKLLHSMHVLGDITQKTGQQSARSVLRVRSVMTKASKSRKIAP